MTQVGITTDNKKVMSGVFKMYDTHGLPLVTILQLMKERDMILSPLHFVEEARDAGWKDKTILSRLGEALTDTYDIHHSNHIIHTIKEVLT